MAQRIKPKISVSEEILSRNTCQNEIDLGNCFQTPYEIFRNNTTAVELIVKEIRHKSKSKTFTNVKNANSDRSAINRLNEDVEKLRTELHKTNLNLDEARRGFEVILCEMKKQLEEANQRELKTQTKNLALLLEKEKLKTLLESKSNLVTKLKKELLGMRSMLKVVLKGIHFKPSCLLSDLEYDEFEKDLNNDIFVTGNDFCNDQ